MDQHCLTDALVLSKRVGNLLFETLGLSEELGQALDRNDQVSVQMLVAMRAEPIEKLKTADQALRALRDSISDPEERQHLSALLKGEAPSNEKERLLTDQAESNARQLKRVLELDQRLNRRIARDKSVYR
jgi:vacuolar-type H+-ATPase subunit I/STV1